MKNIFLLVFLIISATAFSIPRIGTETGNIAPTVEAEGFNSESILGKITILKFWQST